MGGVRTTTKGRRIGIGCGIAATALLALAYASNAATMIIAVIALALAGLIAQLFRPASSRPARRDRLLLPLTASVAASTVAALTVVWAAVTPEGPIPCVSPDSATRLELAAALAVQLLAAVVVVRAADRDRGTASWRAYLRHNPRIRASLAVALHLVAPAATLATLAGATACHYSHTRLLDTIAAGAVAAAIAAVDVLLTVRLVGLAILTPARRTDTDGIELALLAADIRSVAHLHVVQVAHDELMVTARVGVPAGADVAETLDRAHAHIRDFVPTARHIYLQPESRS
jgi:Co/Zn/Cd efflux system component